MLLFFFFFNDTATTEIYTLSLHDALPICPRPRDDVDALRRPAHPHYLFGLLRVEKLRDCLSRVTLRTLGALSQLVDLGVRVPVVATVEVVHRLEHGGQPLRGRGSVEVDERVSVYALRERRHFLPEGLDVELPLRAAMPPVRPSRRGAGADGGHGRAAARGAT